MTEPSSKAPVHLWVVGILALLWNAVGAFDYTATQMRIESYMRQFTQEQLDYFYAFPAWVDGFWAIAVWGSLLGSLALLLKKSWAVWLFGIAIVLFIMTLGFNLIADNISHRFHKRFTATK